MSSAGQKHDPVVSRGAPERNRPPLTVESPSPASDGFDPLRDLLVAQKCRPAHLSRVNLRTLTPFQRSLLVIDGTVTKFIEAYTMEPVRVVRISQDTRKLSDDHPWLELAAGENVIAREVLLQGRFNDTVYAYAVSLLAVGRLHQEVRDDLTENPGGLGQILLKHKLETRRDVLWYGREHLEQLPEPVRHMTDGRFLSRAYRVMANERPLMMINEKFPVEVSESLSHH